MFKGITHRKFIILTVHFIGLLCGHSVRPLNATTVQLNEMRQCPNLAAAITHQQISQGLAERQFAVCPVLSKLITWQALYQGYPSLDFKDYSDFVRDNSNWPWIHEIRINGEKVLRKLTHKPVNAHNIKICEKFFKNGLPYTLVGLKYYIKALQSMHQLDKAHQVVKNFWHQRPLNQDDTKQFLILYSAWLSKKDHNQRLTYLLHKNYIKTLSQILPYMEKNNDALKCLHLLVTAPGQGLKTYLNLPQSVQQQPQLASLFLRVLSNTDNDRAAAFIISNAAIVKKNFSDHEKFVIKVCRQLIQEKKYDQAFRIAKIMPDGPDHKFFLIGLIHYLKNNFIQCAGFMAQGYPYQSTASQQSLYAYWAGLGFQTAGHSIKATEWWDKAAQHQRTYYGQLAAKKIASLSIDKITSFKKATFSDDDMRVIQKNHLIQAIYYLNKLHLYKEAPAFIYALRHELKTSNHSDAALAYIAKIAPLLVCELAQLIHCMQDYRLAYPNPFKDFLDESVISKSLTLSIIRKESNFYPYAISPAGAHGLMQLMLPTAQGLCEQMQCTVTKEKLLNEPALNMRLGQQYLKQLYDMYDGHEVLATAAYNAGYGNVNKWIASIGDPRSKILPELFIELIPFRETRLYVKQVLEVKQVYQAIMQKL